MTSSVIWILIGVGVVSLLAALALAYALGGTRM
jgi:flagellar basal body-associated protein FliL